MAETTYTDEQFALKCAVESKETHHSTETVLRYAEAYLKWLKTKSNEIRDNN